MCFNGMGPVLPDLLPSPRTRMNPTRNVGSTSANRPSRLRRILCEPFAARLAAVVGIFIVFAWGLLGFDFWQHETQGRAVARERAAASARALDERVVRTLRVADQLMKVVGEEIKEDRSWSDARRVTRILRRLDPHFDEILTVSFVDARGRGVGQSNPTLPMGFNHAGRDYFRAHAAAPDLGLYVEAPMFCPDAGQRIFTVSRRVADAGGVFLGVLVAVIRGDALAGDFARDTIGKRGAANFFHIPSQRLIVRQPDYEGTFGKVLPYGDLQREMARDSKGTFLGNSMFDGEERIFAYRRIGDLPLAVSVGLSTGDIRADLLRQFAGYLTMALALSVVIGGGALFLFAAHRRENILRDSMCRWQQIFEHAGWGIAVGSADGKTLEQMNPAYAHMHGYGVEELTGQPIEMVYPPELRKNIPGNIALNQQQGHRRFESLHLHRDGHVFPVLIDVTTVRGKRNEVLYSIVNVQDISEIHHAQEAMAESRYKLRALAAHQEDMLELERKHIAREVHDELGQLLTALKMDLSLVRLRFAENRPLLGMIEEMRTLVDRTINVVRQVASNLRPAALDLGLTPALEWLVDDFAKRGSIRCILDAGDGEIVLDDSQSTAVFRVIQESLTNIARHAQASEVTISLRASGGRLQVVVKDDGRGFDTEVVGKTRGFGLFGMRERVLALGGTLSIGSAPGKGTTVTIELPLMNSEPS